jgi:hypothetical protein
MGIMAVKMANKEEILVRGMWIITKQRRAEMLCISRVTWTNA